jgi:hypothetical protein
MADYHHHGRPFDEVEYDLDAHYNHRLCLELLMIDCPQHVIKHDQRVCGTDGHEYATQYVNKNSLLFPATLPPTLYIHFKVDRMSKQKICSTPIPL